MINTIKVQDQLLFTFLVFFLQISLFLYLNHAKHKIYKILLQKLCFEFIIPGNF